jgi:hypothetical protein
MQSYLYNIAKEQAPASVCYSPTIYLKISQPKGKKKNISADLARNKHKKIYQKEKTLITCYFP